MKSAAERIWMRLRLAFSGQVAAVRMRRNERGRSGERLAERWLKRRGYRILERNRAVGDDEADLIALDPDGRTLVIVEVKTRQSETPPPEASIHHRKQYYMMRLASRLLQTPQYRNHSVRFDVVAVVQPEQGEPTIRHIPGAFESRF